MRIEIYKHKQANLYQVIIGDRMYQMDVNAHMACGVNKYIGKIKKVSDLFKLVKINDVPVGILKAIVKRVNALSKPKVSKKDDYDPMESLGILSHLGRDM